jgi:hypothetical protein
VGDLWSTGGLLADISHREGRCALYALLGRRKAAILPKSVLSPPSSQSSLTKIDRACMEDFFDEQERNVVNTSKKWPQTRLPGGAT